MASDPPAPWGQQLRNLIIVLVAVVLTVALALGLEGQGRGVSLKALAANSIPLEVALTNGKPTLIEFYADWCTSCQAMAKDMAELASRYQDRVNFALLNVDNTKWLPEMLHYQVDGVPHFVFLDSQATALGSAIGEQPPTIMAANLDALLHGERPPYLQTGHSSDFDPLAPSGAADPRSHGG